MREIPENWLVVSLPDVAFFQEGPGLRKYQYRESGLPFLNIRTFVDGKIDKTLCKFLNPEEVDEKYRHFLVEEGDILIAISGSIGKWAVATSADLPMMLNTSIMRFRPHNPSILNWGYLFWFLRADDFKKQAWDSSTGSAQKNVGPSHVQTFSISLPPSAEQRRIAAKLDSLFERTRRAREELSHIFHV